jgi:hypothetical protein
VIPALLYVLATASFVFVPGAEDFIDPYRDGYALSAVMVSQAVAEGI